MTSPTTTRRQGLVGNTPIKAPVDLATTTNITLSGEQVIDGVLTAGSRVLVKDQTDPTQNGIYDTSSADWTRCADANGNYDLVKGSRVYVTDGAQALTEFLMTSTNPVSIGTSPIVWSASLNAGFIATLAAAAGSALIGFIQDGVGAILRTVQSRLRETVSALDDMTAAEITDVITNVASIGITAKLVSAAALGKAVEFAAGTYLVDQNVTLGVGCNFREGAVLRPGAGVTVTINGMVTGTRRRIFDLSNAGAVVVGTFGGVDVRPEWWGADDAASRAVNLAAFNAAIAFVNARYLVSAYGGAVLLSQMYPCDPGIVIKDYVRLLPDGHAPGQYNNITTSDAPRAGFDCSSSTVADFVLKSAVRCSNFSAQGLSFWGNPAVLQGGIFIASGGYPNLSFNTFRKIGAQAILLGSTNPGEFVQAIKIEGNNAIDCLIGAAGVRTRAFKSGVIEVHVSDGEILNNECHAGFQLAVSNANLNVCAIAVLAVNGGGSEGLLIEGNVCEFADIGMYITGGKHRVLGNRFDTNAGHGFYNASFHSTIANNHAYRNGLDTGSGISFSDFIAETGTALENTYLGNISMAINYGGVGGHVAYSFTDLNSNNASKNSYIGCIPGGALGGNSFAAAPLNFAADRGPAWQCLDGAAIDIAGATPSVSNYKNFRTNNAGATNLSNFLNGTDGQDITVLMNDGNTTIKNGTTIATASGADIAPASGKAYRFRLSTALGKWVQS